MAATLGHAQHRHRGFDGFGTEARVHQDVDTLGPRLGRGLRYPMLDADHVVGVGVMAQEFDGVTGERWRVASLGRVKEVVFGGQDGLLSTMLLVTAVAASGVGNTTVLISGLAGALAGMISMATGAFLGSRAEQDVQMAEIANEARELEEHPGEELAELVVLYQREGLSFSEAQGVAEHIAADKDLWLRTLVEKELGLSPEITSNPIKDAITMGAAFIVGALIPILPYFFIQGNIGIAASVSATLAGLFVLGMGKGRMVQKSPLLQGLEILLIGAAAAGVGFGLGEGIPRLI